MLVRMCRGCGWIKFGGVATVHEEADFEVKLQNLLSALHYTNVIGNHYSLQKYMDAILDHGTEHKVSTSDIQTIHLSKHWDFLSWTKGFG